MISPGPEEAARARDAAGTQAPTAMGHPTHPRHRVHPGQRACERFGDDEAGVAAGGRSVRAAGAGTVSSHNTARARCAPGAVMAGRSHRGRHQRSVASSARGRSPRRAWASSASRSATLRASTISPASAIATVSAKGTRRKDRLSYGSA